MIRSLGLLLLGCLAFWAGVACLIWFYWDRLDLAQGELSRDWALVFHSVAFGLCLLPMAATLLWTSWANRQTADQQLVAVLGGTGLRMFFVLGAGLILTNAVPLFARHQIAFWLWVLVVYLVTLGLEIVVLVRHRDALETQRKI